MNPTINANLQVYLLGTIDFDAALALQRKLIYDVSGNRRQAALILCQHSPLITIGRQGSRAHILCEREELLARQWPVRWVNRGGGCLLHLPGQLAIYPVVALDTLGLGLQSYCNRLQEVIAAVLEDFTLKSQVRYGQNGVWIGSRMVAALGIAVREWIAYYGAIFNVSPALDLFKLVQCSAPGELPMTSLARERNAPVNMALVRQRLIEHFCVRFGFGDMTLFTHHPLLDHEPDVQTYASTY